MCVIYLPLNAKPSQKKTFSGAILGYAENGRMEGYRVWDFDAHKVRQISYAYVVCQEGFYPFRDRRRWLPGWGGTPMRFIPTLPAALDDKEWLSYGYTGEQEEEAILGLQGARRTCPDGGYSGRHPIAAT